MEELIEHFNVSDVLELYESGTLLRWLQAREYHDYEEKLLQIDSAAPLEEKASALCSAFGFAPEETQRAISDMLHTRQREAALKEYAQDAASVDKIIENYLADYEKLKEDIKAHASDEDFIKSAVDQLAAVYQPILQRDCKHFYTELKDSKQDYSLITKQLRFNQATKSYLPADFSMLIASMEKDDSANLVELKKAADTIAQNYMSEFEHQWGVLFNEIEEKHPLSFCALCMNQKINDFIFKNKHDWSNRSLSSWININPQCSKFLKRLSNTNKNKQFIHLSEKPVLVIRYNNALIHEIPNFTVDTQSVDTPKREHREFLLFNSLEFSFYKGGGEIVYMEVPETDESAQS
ncbi:hypothetical protein E4N72_09590 [Treponema vincentii]|uniref:hypothetical protein n=1 Tax=Treponema vincentii TaxID=69710 RepID=UPI0020A542C0|nr:hypothetical protein [Treponema vincentii]UTC46791.1 hypothetical protein E4N72_09590 [Treponema vincentii]